MFNDLFISCLFQCLSLLRNIFLCDGGQLWCRRKTDRTQGTQDYLQVEHDNKMRSSLHACMRVCRSHAQMQQAISAAPRLTDCCAYISRNQSHTRNILQPIFPIFRSSEMITHVADGTRANTFSLTGIYALISTLRCCKIGSPLYTSTHLLTYTILRRETCLCHVVDTQLFIDHMKLSPSI